MDDQGQARFEVRDGPPTWIIWDHKANRQVNSWPYIHKYEAETQTEQLNHMRFRDDGPS